MSNKLKLSEAYAVKDPEKTGVISINDWCLATSEVLDMKLPWRTLRPKLAKLDSNGMLLYDSTFEGLKISSVLKKLNFINKQLYKKLGFAIKIDVNLNLFCQKKSYVFHMD